MGYRSEDGSRSRAGSGRQPAQPSSAGYGAPGDYDPYGEPGQYGQEQYGQEQYGQQPPSTPHYPDQGYTDPGYGTGAYDTGGHGTGGHGTGTYDTGSYDTGGYDTHPGATNDWYSSDPGTGTGNLTDPYGLPGTQVTRDPVRGYPPAPELYAGDGYQRFEADGSYATATAGPGTDQRFHDAPVYDDPVYGSGHPGNGYGGGSNPGDAYDRAFSGAGYPGGPYGDEDEASFRHDGARFDDGSHFDDGGRFDELPPGKRPSRRKGGPGRPKKTGRQNSGPRRPSRILSKSTLVSVTAGIVALAVAATAYMLLTKPGSTAANTAAANPTTRVQAPAGPTSKASAACATQLGKYCHIESRALDPQALTLAEVFRAQFMNTSDGSAFTEAGQRTDKNCTGAIIGANLQDAVKNGKCTQVLRASYVSGNGQIMGTIGVINLVSTATAAKAGTAVDANDFISPLSTSKGVTKKLGQGTGVVEAEYKGHYLILMWAEFTNLKTPATSHQDHILEAFEQDLVSGTVNIDLSERMVTGKPATGA
jgi:hypothetical protein